MSDLSSHNDDARAIIRHVLAHDDEKDIARVGRMLDCQPTLQAIASAFEPANFLTEGLWQWLQDWAGRQGVRLKGDDAGE